MTHRSAEYEAQLARADAAILTSAEVERAYRAECRRIDQARSLAEDVDDVARAWEALANRSIF
jgi:hypothetical protein